MGSSSIENKVLYSNDGVCHTDICETVGNNEVVEEHDADYSRDVAGSSMQDRGCSSRREEVMDWCTDGLVVTMLHGKCVTLFGFEVLDATD